MTHPLPTIYREVQEFRRPVRVGPVIFKWALGLLAFAVLAKALFPNTGA